MLVEIVTVLGIAAGLSLASLMLVSGSAADFRFWPPGTSDWRLWTYVALSGTASLAVPVVAVLDERSFVFTADHWWWAGLAAVGFGAAGFLAATFDLGLEESSGMEGELRTDGMYRVTRNPQIVFLLLLTVGVVLMGNSPYATLVALAASGWLISMPFAEEPWLREQFGAPYEEYCEKVPRFIGWTSFTGFSEDSNPE